VQSIADISGLHIKSVSRAIGQLKVKYLQVNDGNYTFEREQIVPLYNNGDKNFDKRDPDFIKPDFVQQQIAEDLFDRRDAKYSHTKILSDMVGDRMALIRLQTIHGQTRADTEQIIDANAESIKHWPRPKNLINHIGSDNDKPMVWQKIKSDAMFQ
jgi:hypothetical protein